MAANWLPLESNPDVRTLTIYCPKQPHMYNLSLLCLPFVGAEQVHPEVGRVGRLVGDRCDGTRAGNARLDPEAGESVHSAVPHLGHGGFFAFIVQFVCIVSVWAWCSRISMFAQYEKHRSEEDTRLQASPPAGLPEDLFYMKQIIHNACGTIALVHSIANNSE